MAETHISGILWLLAAIWAILAFVGAITSYRLMRGPMVTWRKAVALPACFVLGVLSPLIVLIIGVGFLCDCTIGQNLRTRRSQGDIEARAGRQNIIHPVQPPPVSGVGYDGSQQAQSSFGLGEEAPRDRWVADTHRGRSPPPPYEEGPLPKYPGPAHFAQSPSTDL